MKQVTDLLQNLYNIKVFIATNNIEDTDIIKDNKYVLKDDLYNNYLIKLPKNIKYISLLNNTKTYTDNNFINYYTYDDTIKIITNIIYHPIHVFYNTSHNKIEYKALSYFYKEFENYSIEYQKRLNDTYYIDLYIVDKQYQIPGVCIEINEQNHNRYSENDENIRTNIIKSYKYDIVTIPINDIKEINENFIGYYINLVKTKLIEQLDKHTVGISEDKILFELEKYNIPKDFYNIVGKQMIKDKNNEFSIHIDDIVKYLEIRNISDFTKNQVTKLTRNEDYKTDIVHPNMDDKTYRKIHMKFTVLGFYKLCMLSLTNKAKQTREWFAIAYDKILDLLVLKNKKLHETSKENPEIIKSYKDKLDKTTKEYKLKIKKLKEQLKEKNEIIEENTLLKEKNKKLKQKLNESNKYYKIRHKYPFLKQLNNNKTRLIEVKRSLLSKLFKEHSGKTRGIEPFLLEIENVFEHDRYQKNNSYYFKI